MSVWDRVARVLVLVICASVGLLVVADRAAAAAPGPETLHVAPGKSDPSCRQPCGSIQQAINDGYGDVVNGLASRVTIMVAAGSYDANLVIDAPITGLTIIGSGAGSTFVRGKFSDSVLRVGGGRRRPCPT
jgi:pectin methylesterase-like acyl-CoA thioesterase